MIELAHAFSAGGADVEVLILAAGMLVLGIVFFLQKSTKPIVPVVLVAGAIAVGGGAFALGNSPDTAPPTGLSVSIVAPEDAASVPAGEPVAVRVEVSGGEVVTTTTSTDLRRGHIHLYVDGKIVSMPTTTVGQVRLARGARTITAEFVAADHHSFSPRVIDEVAVRAK